jgi:D-3-phosphoglycerate dehydrogenase
MSEKILIGPSSFAEMDKTPLERLRTSGFQVINNPFGRKLKKEELIGLLAGVTGLIAGLEPLSRDVLEQSQLKVISRCGVGLSNVDLEAADELGIKVLWTPDAPTNSVAELTVGMLISLMRLVPEMDSALHHHIWNKKIGFELRNKTVLIIGFGRIGRRIFQLLKPFEVNIIASDPYLTGEIDDVTIFPLDQALPLADIISLHASGEREILGEREFALMKKGVFLLNGARGGLINEEILVKNLKIGRVVGAWVDSFDEEPYTGPLTQFPQVVLTPHIGSYTEECRRQMEMEAVENLLKGLSLARGDDH